MLLWTIRSRRPIIAAPLAQRRKEEAVDGLVRLLRVGAADGRAVRRHL